MRSLVQNTTEDMMELSYWKEMVSCACPTVSLDPSLRRIGEAELYRGLSSVLNCIAAGIPFQHSQGHSRVYVLYTYTRVCMYTYVRIDNANDILRYLDYTYVKKASHLG